MGKPTEDADAYAEPDVRIVSFVECVCSRPRLYTPSGTVGEVTSFLEGYYLGLRRGGPSVEEGEWQKFKRWLTQRLAGQSEDSWMGALRQTFPEDGTAIKELRLLYLEFCSRENAEQSTTADRPRG
jgi:hypothetical protein